jgi:hypothetical protein
MTQFANEQGRRICSVIEGVLKQISDQDNPLYGIIQDNEECRHHRDELGRLYTALQTYLETDPSLRYVGFVGSFSSGKTATINNLLELTTEKKRPEDINPVDERLTVCAHESRIDSVLAALLKSTWQHDTFVHTADALANVILVDTPGGGDPKIRTDIVHNFLPICDTIVYCFNSTNPLNVSDVPILQEMNQILSHTDFFYVYTRADNVFRLNENTPLTSENFDEIKANRQRDTFTQRLGEALTGIAVRPLELFFVSNAHVPYGINDLRRRLLSPPGDETTLGLKKIAFFRRRSVESIAAILAVLRELRATVAELVAKAEQNHQAYNKKFEIRTEEIKTFWGNAQSTIRATSGRFKELETKHLTSPISLDASEARTATEMEMHKLVGKHASDAVHSLIRELKSLAKDGFEQWKNTIRARLVSDGMPLRLDQDIRETLSISTDTSIPIGEFQRSFGEETEIMSQNLAVEVAQHVIKSLVQRCKDIRSDFDKTSRHSTEGELFQNERELRDGCRREIASAVELYASLIDLYVAGINTAGTMLLIQKANLGRDIDFLQSERIDDDEKRATSEKLIQEIFGQEHQKLGAIEQRCRLIPQEMKSLMSEASALGAQLETIAAELSAGKLRQLSEATSIWDETFRPLIGEYESWQERERDKVVAELVARQHEIGERFEAQKARVITAWKRRLLWVGILGIVVITGALATYYHFGASSEQQSLSEIVFWGAAGNALWALAVFLFERASATRTDWIAASRAVFFKVETSGVARAMLAWNLGSSPELPDLTETCQRRLVDWLDAEVSSKNRQLRQGFQSVADEIELIRKKGLAVVNDYRSAWESARQIIEGLYLETDEKIGRFKSVSTVFKERTIDRTRTLFGERGEELAKHISHLDTSATELQQAP